MTDFQRGQLVQILQKMRMANESEGTEECHMIVDDCLGEALRVMGQDYEDAPVDPVIQNIIEAWDRKSKWYA